jgi:hypothetical protein
LHRFDQCHGNVFALPPIEREEAAQEINFRSNPGPARKHDLTEGWFSP